MHDSTARRNGAALLAPVPVLAALALAANGVVLAGAPAPAAAAFALALLAALLAALIVHDAAHWAAARLLGLRTVAATLGPVAVVPTRRGVHVRLIARWRELEGGLVLDARPERRVHLRFALVAAAGPAASLALALLVMDRAPLLAACSLLRFALAALPLGVRSAPTDGARLLLLAAGGAASDRFCAMQRIEGAQRSGLRPRAWPERWTIDATALRDATATEAAACIAGFRRAVDGCAHERASAYLDRALALRALLPREARCSLLADAAYFEARIRDDAVRARAWLDEAAANRPACPVAERRAAAAVLLASGDVAGGAAAAREALDHLARIEREERRPMPMEADWLREMLERAECAVVLPAELLLAS